MHDENDSLSRNSIEAGRQIDSNDKQEENASASIRVSFDSDSNVNDESDSHDEKDLSPRNSTDAGRQMDINDKQEWNESAPISDSADLNSNAINSAHRNSRNDEERLSPKIRVIMRGMTRLGTVTVAEIETDKNRTWNTPPSK
jgi:hypothetical protein